MDRDELLTRLGGILNRVVQKKVDPASVTEDARLLEDLGVGSVEANDMIFEIEDALDLEFQDEEVLGLRGGSTMSHSVGTHRLDSASKNVNTLNAVWLDFGNELLKRRLRLVKLKRLT